MASSPAVPPPWRSAKKTQVRSTKSLGASPSRLSRVSAASNPWQWQWWLKAPAPPDEPTEAEHAAAECIQRWGRGYNARWQFKAAVHGLAGKPSLQRARDYKRYMQPHTLEVMKDGTHKVVPLPLSCPIECFHAFGEGIYCYMLWMRLMKRTFAVAFAFALGNMAHNWAGGNELDCGGNCWLSVHTIGNVGSLNASYGVSELLVLGVLLYALFGSVAIVRTHGRLASGAAEHAVARPHGLHGPHHHHPTTATHGHPPPPHGYQPYHHAAAAPHTTTLADHTVMLEGLPPVPPAERELAVAMGGFGAVHSCHIAFAIRDVLLRMPERKRRLQDLHAARCNLRLLREQQPPIDPALKRRPEVTTKQFQRKLTRNQQKQAACSLRVRDLDALLAAHDAESEEMLRQPRDCTGHAFVTFVDAAAAAAAIEAINAHAAGGGGSGGRRSSDRRSSARLSTDRRSSSRASRASRTSRAGNDGGGDEEEGADIAARAAAGVGALLPAGVAPLRASRAPHPTDLQWANLEFSRRDRQRRHLVSTSVMLLLSCFGSSVIAFVTYATGNNLFASLVAGNLPEGFLGVVCGLLFALALAVPTILSNVMLFFSVPQLAERYEMHHTHAGKEVSCMLKLCFFEVFNTVVSVAAFFIDSNVWHNTRQWYSLGGAMLVNVLIGDATFLQWLLDGGPLCQLGIYLSARRARTQLEMNEKLAEPAGIVLAFRLSLAGKFVVLATMFGSASKQAGRRASPLHCTERVRECRERVRESASARERERTRARAHESASARERGRASERPTPA